MALIERLCQIDLGDPGGEPPERHMALNPFVEAMYAILVGRHTVAQAKGYWNMIPADEAEFDTMVAQVQAHPATVDRMLAVSQIRQIMTFWEMRRDYPAAGYTTVADIRQKLLNDL